MKNRFNFNFNNLFASFTTRFASKIAFKFAFLLTFLFVILVSGCKPYQKQVCSGQPIANSHWNSGSNTYKKSLNGPNSSSVAHLGMIGSCSFSCDTVNGYSPDAAGTSCIVPAQGAIVGHYIDAPVKGLRYVAMPSGLTGLTLDSGAFDCMQGDNVKFYLGAGTSIFMGQATCSTKILLSSNKDQTGTAITNSAMWEISVLLTALNKPGLDPANAIDVSDFANLVLNPVDLSTGKVYMTGINAVLNSIKLALPARTLNVSKFLSCSVAGNPACYGPAVNKAKALVSNAIEYYSGSNTPVCKAGEYLNVAKTACIVAPTCAGAQTFDVATNTCVDPICAAPQVLDPVAHLCVTPQVACTLANALLNGIVVTNSNSTIQGTTDGVDFNQCLLDATSCNSGFQISADNKSCVAITASCTVTDATSNGVNFTNTSAQPVGSNANVQGSVSALDVSQCLLTPTACVTNYQTALDGKSCTPVITTCVLADAIANGTNVLNSNSSVQGSVVAGNQTACTLAVNACDAGYQLAGDSKSCSAIISSCTTIDAIANGVITTNSNSSVQGSVVAGSTAQCLLADLACNSGYSLATDKKSCSAIVTTCTIGDATTNGVNVANSNSTLQGSVVAGSTAQCTLADLACNGGYQLSLDKKSCVASSVACTIADATANGVNFTNSNSTVQGLATGLDVSQCTLATNACDSGFLLSADSKSCFSSTQPNTSCPVLGVTNASFNLGINTYTAVWNGTSYGAIGNTFTVDPAVSCGYQCNTGFGSTDGGVSCVQSFISGEKIWTRQLGVAAQQTQGQGIVSDSFGNTYSTGYTQGSLDGLPMSAGAYAFIAKYDNTGTKQWTRQFGAAGVATMGNGITLDVSGNIYVVGWSRGSVNGQPLTGYQDAFIAKYDSAGTQLWTRQLGIAGGIYLYGMGVTTDNSGNVFIAGSSGGALDGQPFIGIYDTFVTKYDGTGVKQWTRQFGAAGKNTNGLGVVSDISGNVYIGGNTTGSLDGQILTGTTDAFITKYDNAGTKQWTRQFGAAGVSTFGRGVTRDNVGNILLVGYTSGALVGQILTGTTDTFITKYDNMGTKLWTRQFGIAGVTFAGYGITSDGLGNTYIGATTVRPVEGYATLVVKHDSAGTKQWEANRSIATGTITYGVTTDGLGNVYTGGYTQGSLDSQPLIGTKDLFIIKYKQ